MLRDFEATYKSYTSEYRFVLLYLKRSNSRSVSSDFEEHEQLFVQHFWIISIFAARIIIYIMNYEHLTVKHTIRLMMSWNNL